jgi:hypothetical protein
MLENNKYYSMTELLNTISEQGIKLSPITLRGWCRNGLLKTVKPSKLYYIKGSDFNEFFFKGK